MARSPKFRRFDYPLFAAIMGAGLPGSTYAILLAVFDMTLGYQKDCARISLSRFMDKTWLSKNGVIKAIKDAERRHIIEVDRTAVNAKTPAEYRLEVDSSSWTRGQPHRRPQRGTSALQFTSELAHSSAPLDANKPELQGPPQCTGKVHSSAPRSTTPVDPTSPLSLRATPSAICKESLNESSKVCLEGSPKGTFEAFTPTKSGPQDDIETTTSQGAPPPFEHDPRRAKTRTSQRERILAFLTAQGPSEVSAIVAATAIPRQQVANTLTTRRDFEHIAGTRTWRAIQPQCDTPRAGNQGGGRSMWSLPEDLDGQECLHGQDGHIEKSGHLNQNSFENHPEAARVGQQNIVTAAPGTATAALGRERHEEA
jgi:hypothetical protein